MPPPVADSDRLCNWSLQFSIYPSATYNLQSYHFGVIPPGTELDYNAGRGVWHAAGSMSDCTLPPT